MTTNIQRATRHAIYQIGPTFSNTMTFTVAYQTLQGYMTTDAPNRLFLAAAVATGIIVLTTSKMYITVAPLEALLAVIGRQAGTPYPYTQALIAAKNTAHGYWKVTRMVVPAADAVASPRHDMIRMLPERDAERSQVIVPDGTATLLLPQDTNLGNAYWYLEICQTNGTVAQIKGTAVEPNVACFNVPLEFEVAGATWCPASTDSRMLTQTYNALRADEQQINVKHWTAFNFRERELADMLIAILPLGLHFIQTITDLLTQIESILIASLFVITGPASFSFIAFGIALSWAHLNVPS
jgi:hypothetical protein